MMDSISSATAIVRFAFDAAAERVDRSLQLIVLTIAAMAGLFSRSALGPVQEAVRTSLHLTDNQMALLQGAALALPLSLTAIPLGLAVDRYSRVRLMILALMLAVAGTALSAWASGFWLLFASRCVVGFAAPATAIIAFSLLADLYVPRQRGRATMMIVLGQSAGSSVAFAVGGELAALTRGHAYESWRWALTGMAALLLPCVLLAMLLKEPPRTGSSEPTLRTSNPLFRLREYRGILIVLLGAMCLVNLADGAVLVWAAPALSRNFNLPSDRIGAIMASALLVGGFSGPLIGGAIADSCQRAGGPRRTVSVLTLLVLLSIPMSFFAVMPGVASASIPLVLFMAIGTALSVMTTAVAIIVIPNELRGLCVSIKFAGAIVFGLGLAPLTVSVLAGFLGGPLMIGKALAYVCATASLIGALILASGRRHFPVLEAR